MGYSDKVTLRAYGQNVATSQTPISRTTKGVRIVSETSFPTQPMISSSLSSPHPSSRSLAVPQASSLLLRSPSPSTAANPVRSASSFRTVRLPTGDSLPKTTRPKVAKPQSAASGNHSMFEEIAVKGILLRVEVAASLT
jgi:hypothetical protein